MSDGTLTQEQIDMHFKKMLEENKSKQEVVLSEEDIDVIGEAGNIFISTSATSLSTILNKRVQMTTPVVGMTTLAEIHENMSIPYVVVTIKFQKGLDGSNLLLIKTEDASIIADIMMGGDGSETKLVLDEIELSAVAEAMNQMIGSAATSIATMLDRPIEISSPETEVWEELADISNNKRALEDQYVKIAFKMIIEDLLKTDIIQLYSLTAVREIIDTLTSGIVDDELEPLPDKPLEINSEDAQVSSPSSNPEAEDLPLPKNMELLLDVLLDLNVVFGKTRKSIKEILTFGAGTVIELDESVEDPVEIYINNKLIAYGEVVAVDDKYGVRVTNIVSERTRANELLQP